MQKSFFAFLLVSVVFLSACGKMSALETSSAQNEISGEQLNQGSGDGDQVTPVTPYKPEPLSWEAARSEGKLWSTYAFKVIREEAFADLDRAMDVDIFCPNYDSLSKDQRINFWGGLFSGMARFESNYSPVSRYHEDTMGTDPVTKLPVYSEGLLQLSYQDVQWAKYCEFDWSQDKLLSPTDPKKSILDPYKNLRCGIKILAAQVKRTREIVLSSGAYWSVIKEGSRYQKIDQIAAITQKLSFCRK